MPIRDAVMTISHDSNAELRAAETSLIVLHSGYPFSHDTYKLCIAPGYEHVNDHGRGKDLVTAFFGMHARKCVILLSQSLKFLFWSQSLSRPRGRVSISATLWWAC
jgi:hypothetical protein